MSDEFYIWSSGDKIQFTKNFSSKEFECPGSKEHKISKELIQLFQTFHSIKLPNKTKHVSFNVGIQLSLTLFS